MSSSLMLVDQPIPVLFIGGAGRSGSTLLASILGQSPDGFAAGEVTHLWERGLLKDELCGCGEPFSRCEFWTEVVQDAFGTIARSDVLEVEESRQRCCRLSTLPLWLFPKFGHSILTKARSRYEPFLVALYRSILKISGKQVVIDSSKFPPESLLLERCSSIDLRLLHLVRNCKAVVYAWQKEKRRPEVHWRSDYFKTYHPLKTCSAWLFFNRIFEAQSVRLGSNAAQTRYEDLVQGVQSVSESVCQDLSLRQPADLCAETNLLRATSNHMVSGNPSRLNKGNVPLRLDRDWEDSLAWRYRFMVDVLAGRAQRHYGY